MPTKLQIQTKISSNISKVWKYFTEPEHIKSWNHASDDWYCPDARNDFRVGGEFHYIMSEKPTEQNPEPQAKFDFFGVFTEIEPLAKLSYKLSKDKDDPEARKVENLFEKIDENTTILTINFDPETQNSLEMQKSGWQAILDNFKKYCEEN